MQVPCVQDVLLPTFLWQKLTVKDKMNKNQLFVIDLYPPASQNISEDTKQLQRCLNYSTSGTIIEWILWSACSSYNLVIQTLSMDD